MVVYLKKGSEKIPVKVGFYALKHFQKETGKNIAELESDLSFEDIECLFYHAYINGCKSDGSYPTPKYSREDMELLLDDLYQDFLKVIPSFFKSKKK